MIYLDHNATTFIDPLVWEEIEPLLKGKIGNPSSIHQYGQRAHALLAKATKEVAAFFGVTQNEVIFTSGATEGLNMVIRGLPRGSHVITSSLEHVATLESLKVSGCEVSYLDPLPGRGAITLRQIEEALRPTTSAVVVMAANNETGVKTAELESIADFALQRGLSLIVDGVALLGKGNWKLPKGVAAAVFSGHKIHAPAGTGVVIVRRPMRAQPLIVGGPQQHQLRGGTENLAGIVGFAKALTLLPESGHAIATLRDHLESELCSRLHDVVIHGVEEPRVCNTSHSAFLGVDAETLLMQLDLAGVAVSHGSACSSGIVGPSRVLLNMGVSPQVARSSIRISLSRFTTLDEIDRALTIITACVTRLRELVS